MILGKSNNWSNNCNTCILYTDVAENQAIVSKHANNLGLNLALPRQSYAFPRISNLSSSNSY